MAPRRTVIFVVVALVLVAALIAVTFGLQPVTNGSGPVGGSTSTANSAYSTPWGTVQLTDVLSGNPFKLSDFKGKPILVEQMAIWCPLCAQQQDELQAVKQKLGDKVVIISVDIDSKETPQNLANYATSKNHMWIWGKDTGAFLTFFQLAPPDTPVVVISPDGTYKLFSGKITTSSDFLAYLQTLGVTA